MWYIILLFFVIDYYSTQIMRLVTWKEKRDYKALGKKCSKILKLVAKGCVFVKIRKKRLIAPLKGVNYA